MAFLTNRVVAGRIPGATHSSRIAFSGPRIRAAPTVLHRGVPCRASDDEELNIGERDTSLAGNEAPFFPSIDPTVPEAFFEGSDPAPPAPFFPESEFTESTSSQQESLAAPAALSESPASSGGGGGGKDSGEGTGIVANDEMSGAEIKAALLDSLYGTERGLAARSEVRAEINELITQLEAKNPNANPTDTISLLDGNWKLVYTSSPVLISILALGRLPLVTIGDLTQYIDTTTNTIENKFLIQGPLSSTAFSTTASYEIRSPKRLQFKLERGTISTPSLVQDIEIPPSINIMGQAIDLTDFNSVLKPLSEGLGGLLQQAGNLISQAPDINIPLQSNKAQTWQLNTYVDDDLRIIRGDGGAVFIAVKQQ